ALVRVILKHCNNQRSNDFYIGYIGADYSGWCREAGFKNVEVLPLTGRASAQVVQTLRDVVDDGLPGYHEPADEPFVIAKGTPPTFRDALLAWEERHQERVRLWGGGSVPSRPSRSRGSDGTTDSHGVAIRGDPCQIDDSDAASAALR
ncbi:MAG TPA: hypothetical protein VNU01_00300, partial [Egibacteraceae bacterium]|nr:hypothetical protein [Egibacteraceae bacterium]